MDHDEDDVKIPDDLDEEMDDDLMDDDDLDPKGNDFEDEEEDKWS